MSNETQSVSVGAAEPAPWYRTLPVWFRAVRERTVELLVYSTAYLVVVAMLEAVLVIASLGLSWSLAPVVIGLLTFSVYAGDRIADVETDAATTPGQSTFVRRHRTVFSVLTAAAYGLAIAIALTAGPAALALTLLPGGVWILYGSDWLPRLSRGVRRLKEVLVVNSLVVAVAWAVTLVLIPVAFVDAALSGGVVVLFAYLVVDRFVNTEIPNVQDAAGDAAIGVATLPVVFGVRRTRHILSGLSVLLLALLGGAFLAGVLSAVVAGAFAVGVAYTLAVTAAVGRTANDGVLAIASELKHILVLGVIVVQSGVPL